MFLVPSRTLVGSYEYFNVNQKIFCSDCKLHCSFCFHSYSLKLVSRYRFLAEIAKDKFRFNWATVFKQYEKMKQNRDNSGIQKIASCLKWLFNWKWQFWAVILVITPTNTHSRSLKIKLNSCIFQPPMYPVNYQR